MIRPGGNQYAMLGPFALGKVFRRDVIPLGQPEYVSILICVGRTYGGQISDEHNVFRTEQMAKRYLENHLPAPVVKHIKWMGRTAALRHSLRCQSKSRSFK